MPLGIAHPLVSGLVTIGPSGLVVIFLTALYVRTLVSWSRRTRGLPLPPGPKPLPFVGNMFDIPTSKMCEGYRNLTDKYGDKFGLVRSVLFS